MESAEAALAALDNILAPHALSNLQERIVRGCWEGKTYTQIAETTGYDDDYIRDVGFQLWRRLSQTLGEKVSKSNFKTVLRRLAQSSIASTPSPTPSTPHGHIYDWGTAADVPHFYGRDRELTTLTQWIKADRCRLISILGMGGIGKTSFTIRLAQTLQEDFDGVIWRSLKAAPPLSELLNNLLKTLAPATDVAVPEAIAGKLEQLMTHLRKSRCLIVLDNFDILLQSGEQGGVLQPQYAQYQDLLQLMGEMAHTSCILLTSREKPQGMDALEGDALPVRTLYLQGLDPAACQNILTLKGLGGSEPEQSALIDFYRGHPLALKIVSTSIRDLFSSSISQFLRQGSGAFNGLRKLLTDQLQRLSPLEQAILYWLAINCEPVAIAQLQSDLIPEPLTVNLLEALESLRRRSLVETASPVPIETTTLTETAKPRFTLQPVVMECLITDLIERISTELLNYTPQYFLSHALIKAQTEDSIRNSQTRLLLEPLTARLISHFGSEVALSQHLQTVLRHLQTLPTHQMGYGGGNLLNLFRHLQTELTGFNFSGLFLRQALLHDLSLRRTNFAQATFRQCSFANAFGGITCIAFSPDGDRFATCDTNGKVSIWSVAEMHPITQCIGHDFWAWAIAFHPTQPLLASCGQDRTIRLWDTETGNCIKVLQGHTSIVTDVAFSPDGRTLMSSSTDTTLKQWNIQTGDCLQTLKGHEKCVWGVVFTADGQRLYSGGEDNCIRTWDLQTGVCLQVFSGHTQWVMAIALSPDERQLASASMDGTVKVWCTATGNCLNTLSGHLAPVVSVAFSTDGQTLASGSYDQTIRLWNAHTGACTQRLNQHTNRIWCVKFHPNGTLLASGGDDNTTRFWNPSTGEASTTLQGYSNGIYELALHPHQPILASVHEDQTVRLWHLPQSGAPTAALEPYQTLRGHQNRVFAIAFSPDGNTLASGSFDRTIRLWNPETHQCHLTLQGHKSWVWDIAFHPNSNTLASASYDRTVKLWDVETGHCTHTLEGHLGSALSVGFSPNGQWLASGGYEQILKLWQPESGECIRTWHAHSNRVWAVVFSPNSQWLATAGEDGNIIIWDVETGDRLQVLSGHQQPVLCVRFSADGRQLFSSGSDRTIKQWDLATGQCLQTFAGHGHWVWSLALLSSKILLSASQDESIQCWDLEMGQSIQRLEVQRPYAEMDITDAKGLTDAQRQTLTALGATHQKEQA
jgi:WD40 repeat protein